MTNSQKCKKNGYLIGQVLDIIDTEVNIYSRLETFGKYKGFNGTLSLLPFFIYAQRSYMLQNLEKQNKKRFSKLIIDIKYIMSSVRPEIYNVFKYICNSNVKDFNVSIHTFRIKIESNSDNNKLKSLAFRIDSDIDDKHYLESARLNNADLKCNDAELFLLFSAVCSMLHLKEIQGKIQKEQIIVKRIEQELGKFK